MIVQREFQNSMTRKTVTMVGLGKVGLPLAVRIAEAGHRVIGADINPVVVDHVNHGREPFPGEAELAERLAAVVTSGALGATTDTTAAVRESEVVLVIVPLVVDDEARPDFSIVDAATTAIAEGLRPGTLVCYETTLPVGTTRERLLPALESMSGLTAGQDLFVCMSPERVLTGRVFADLRRYPKLVGGVDAESTRCGVAFYESVLEFDERTDLDRANGVWSVDSTEAAELIKLAETTYRDVNIALTNTFARYADSVGVDIVDVIQAANSQPYAHLHLPSIAVGGHCIPVYPRLYLSGDPDALLPLVARQVNAEMPEYAVQLLSDLYGSLAGARVVVLGACYRGGVKETAFSGVFPTVRALQEVGARVSVHDPMFGDDELRQFGFAPYHYGEPCDAAILQTDHDEYRTLAPADLPGVRALVDGRNSTDPHVWEDVPRAVIGRGSTRPADRLRPTTPVRPTSTEPEGVAP